MIEMPNKTELEYLNVFGATAIFVAASPTGRPCLIGYTHDLMWWRESLRERWHWSIDYAAAWWLADQTLAARIVDAVNNMLASDKRGLFDDEAEHVARMIEIAAASLGIVLTPNDDALARVRAALTRVDGVIENANANGDLAWFNAAYRDRRVEDGAGMSYGQARDVLRRALVRRIASGIGGEQCGPDLLPGNVVEAKPKIKARQR